MHQNLLALLVEARNDAAEADDFGTSAQNGENLHGCDDPLRNSWLGSKARLIGGQFSDHLLDRGRPSIPGAAPQHRIGLRLTGCQRAVDFVSSFGWIDFYVRPAKLRAEQLE